MGNNAIATAVRAAVASTKMKTSGNLSSNDAELRGQGELLADARSRNADLRLIRRAVRGGWNVPRRIKHAIVQRMGEEVEACELEEFIQLGKLAAVLDGVDLKTEALAAQREKSDAPSSGNVFINASGDVSVAVQQALNDPEYIEFRRQQAVRRALEPGSVCGNGERGAVANGSAPGLPGPGTNGSH